MLKALPPLPRRPVYGMATLTVVMVLFFVMALVAAYANRNLLVEQRVSTNSYRAERASAAAESGIEWTIALLNRGRVDIQCQPSSNSGDLSARERYLNRGASGIVMPVAVAGKILGPSCAIASTQFACACPTSGVPDPVPHAVQSWPINSPASAFRATITDMNLPVGTDVPAGLIMLEVQGCGSPGQGNTGCASTDPTVRSPQVDGFGRVRVFLGLMQALPQVPTAALTAGQTITATDTLTVANADPATGLSVRAGVSITAATSRYAGPAGSSDAGVLNGDASLSGLVPTAQDRFKANDRLFRATFGLDAPTYRRQPAVVRIACGNAGCSMDDLETAIARYPGLTYWFDGDLNLSSVPTGPVGTATHPLMVIVTGNLTVSAAMDLTGFFYASRIDWTGGGAGASLRGALMAAETFQADVPATVAYDAGVLQTIRLYYGSFVRVPASWSRP